MIEIWHNECQMFDVSIQDGRLVLSQGTDNSATSFEDQLGGLSKKWSEVVSNVENRKTEVETIAKDWWDFSKSKSRMLKWMEKKKTDLENEAAVGGGLENAVELEKKLKVSISPFIYFITSRGTQRFLGVKWFVRRRCLSNLASLSS